MGEAKLIEQDTLDQARDLVAHMEAGNEAEVKRVLDDLAKVREAELFQELGRLTRDLHDTLNSFKLDSQIVELAEQEIPDAQERLNYVISMTEQAADKVLTAVEDSLPVSEDLQRRSSKLQEQWGRFRKRQLSVDEFRELSRDLDAFFPQVEDSAKMLQKNLSDVLMAQDFQDLTGQIIRKVITLVKDVEDNLVHLIRISGKGAQGAREESKEKDGTQPQGPHVPGVDKGNVIEGQDDVDELLSSLGF